MRIKAILLFLVAALSLGLLYQQCQSPSPVVPQSPFRTIYDTSVHYVGIQTCKGCHADIYNTFIHTGMGQSWDLASPHKSAARFGAHEVVYDTLNNLYYHPYWDHERLYIEEYRLNGTDTIHKRIEQVKYIVGSGQHTNSHIIDINGYLYQAPITFYTQQQIWDLAPGFEKGSNSKFTRIIGQECMTCHNHLPETDYRAENHFQTVHTGIECERCHGPGSLHVSEKQAGKLVDISKETDYSIVNPKKLSRELQINLCQRCHLQGITVLNQGRQFADFRPGMLLSEVMHTFIPRYTDSLTHFIMASHADRMKMSACFRNSNMTCLSCHDPHISVKATPAETFTNACLKCHSDQQKACTEKESVRKAVSNNCITCHMPMSGSIEVTHVKIHDHNIRKTISDKQSKAIGQFVRLANVSDKTPETPDISAEAYLNFYEEYVSASAFLDSAAVRLARCKSTAPINSLYIRLYYLRQDYAAILKLANQFGQPNSIHDAWTAYRIGEAYLQTASAQAAIPYLSTALSLRKGEPDFMNKLSIAYIQATQNEQAERLLQQLLQLNPEHVSGLTNMGYLQALKGNLPEAEKYYLRALQLNPDYEQALINMAAKKQLDQKRSEAIAYLKRALKVNPANRSAQAALKQISGGLY